MRVLDQVERHKLNRRFNVLVVVADHRRHLPLIALHWGIDSLPSIGAVLGPHH